MESAITFHIRPCTTSERDAHFFSCHGVEDTQQYIGIAQRNHSLRTESAELEVQRIDLGDRVHNGNSFRNRHVQQCWIAVLGPAANISWRD